MHLAVVVPRGKKPWVTMSRPFLSFAQMGLENSPLTL